MTAILVDLTVNIKITKTADSFIHSTYTVNAWKHQRSLTTIQIKQLSTYWGYNIAQIISFCSI